MSKNGSDVHDIELLPPLRDVIASHNLRAEKKFGQNFLLDINITDKIVRAAGDLSGIHVIEIGPGPGGLTRSLLKSNAQKITAIEFDPRAVGALQDLIPMSQGRLEVIEADALSCDLTKIKPGPKAIISNLPYNIATPLLMHWLQDLHKDPESYSTMILMFQKEVAMRIVAESGSNSFGRLSIIAQWICDAGRVFDLPPSAFTPPPKVTSSVVQFRPRIRPVDDPSFEAVERITAAAFGQRRKMLRSAMKQIPGVLQKAEIDETKRAEELGVVDFIRMAKCLNA